MVMRQVNLGEAKAQAITDTMPVQPGSARDFVRRMRDSPIF
jgi:hypothetical protein